MTRLIDQTDSGRVVLENLEVAQTFWARFRGLQFRRPLAPDAGLWLSPCSSLHTCFMWFPIDVMMLDRDGVVLGIRRNVRPWRIMIAVKGTHSVIETALGALDVPVGNRVVVDDAST